VWSADSEEDSQTDEHIDVTSSDGATFGACMYKLAVAKEKSGWSYLLSIELI